MDYYLTGINQLLLFCPQFPMKNYCRLSPPIRISSRCHPIVRSHNYFSIKQKHLKLFQFWTDLRPFYSPITSSYLLGYPFDINHRWLVSPAHYYVKRPEISYHQHPLIGYELSSVIPPAGMRLPSLDNRGL